MTHGHLGMNGNGTNGGDSAPVVPRYPTAETDGELWGAIIRRLMEQRRMTNADLARALNLNGSTVSGWVRGKAFPRKRLMAQLIAHFGDALLVALPADWEIPTTEPPDDAPGFVAQGPSPAKLANQDNTGNRVLTVREEQPGVVRVTLDLPLSLDQAARVLAALGSELPPS